jgi:hypothetical protein
LFHERNAVQVEKKSGMKCGCFRKLFPELDAFKSQEFLMEPLIPTQSAGVMVGSSSLQFSFPNIRQGFGMFNSEDPSRDPPHGSSFLMRNRSLTTHFQHTPFGRHALSGFQGARWIECHRTLTVNMLREFKKRSG